MKLCFLARISTNKSSLSYGYNAKNCKIIPNSTIFFIFDNKFF